MQTDLQVVARFDSLMLFCSLRAAAASKNTTSSSRSTGNGYRRRRTSAPPSRGTPRSGWWCAVATRTPSSPFSPWRSTLDLFSPYTHRHIHIHTHTHTHTMLLCYRSELMITSRTPRPDPQAGCGHWPHLGGNKSFGKEYNCADPLKQRCTLL